VVGFTARGNLSPKRITHSEKIRGKDERGCEYSIQNPSKRIEGINTRVFSEKEGKGSRERLLLKE